ncbi:Zinc finger, CCHC-type [Sesbania bispinosa]|nr:Zinc finger, CCHC-type [Sesbania bispinosa]
MDQNNNHPIIMGSLEGLELLLEAEGDSGLGAAQKMKNLPRIWVFIKYERIQGFCYNCGIIGHDDKKCKKTKEIAIYDPSRPRYGPNLGIPLVKSLAAIVAENVMRIKLLKHKEDVEGSNDIHTADGGGATNGTDKGQNMLKGNVKDEKVAVEGSTTIEEQNIPEGPRWKTSPGLGPKTIDKLRVEKEFIGLREDVIIKDYPSPKYKGSSLYGLSLTGKEVLKCRDSWLFSNNCTTEAYNHKNKGGFGSKQDGSGLREATKNYYVEFP